MSRSWASRKLTRVVVFLGVALLAADNQQACGDDTHQPVSQVEPVIAGDDPKPETKVPLTKDVTLEFTLQKPSGNFLWGLDLVHEDRAYGDRESFLYNNLYDDLRTDRTCTYYFDRSSETLWIGTLEAIKKCTWKYDPSKRATLPSIITVGPANHLNDLIAKNVLPPEFAKHMSKIVATAGTK